MEWDGDGDVGLHDGLEEGRGEERGKRPGNVRALAKLELVKRSGEFAPIAIWRPNRLEWW